MRDQMPIIEGTKDIGLFTSFTEPIEQVMQLLLEQGIDISSLMDVLSLSSQIYNNKTDPRFLSLQFRSLQTMFDQLIKVIGIENSDIVDSLKMVFQQYFWEKFSDDLAVLSDDRMEFINKDILKLFHDICTKVLQGGMNIIEGVTALYNTGFSVSWPDNLPNDILDAFAELKIDRDKLSNFFLCVNLVATLNASNAIREYSDWAHGQGYGDILNLALNGHVQRQDGNRAILIYSSDSDLNSRWENSALSILTNSTFGSIIIFLLKAKYDAGEDLSKYLSKKSVASLLRAVETGATPLIRAYNDGGPIFDDLKKTLAKIDNLMKNARGKYISIFDLIKCESGENVLFNRLLKDMDEREFNVLLAGIALDQDIDKQLMVLKENISHFASMVNEAKKVLITECSNLPREIVELILGFTVFNYYNYALSGIDYDKEMYSVSDIMQQALLKFIGTHKLISIRLLLNLAVQSLIDKFES